MMTGIRNIVCDWKPEPKQCPSGHYKALFIKEALEPLQIKRPMGVLFYSSN